MLLDYVNPFSFDLVTLPFKALFSFTGFIAILGWIATRVGIHYLAEHGYSAWKQVSIALTILIAVFLFAPMREPTQFWLYSIGFFTLTVAVFALSFALIAIGPIFVRFFRSVTMLGALISAGVLGFGLSNYSIADQSLKRGNITTPYEAIRALNAASDSTPVESETDSYQLTGRDCNKSDAICVAVVRMYDIPKIKQALGLTEIEWYETFDNDFNSLAVDIDFYQVRHRNLSIILAQGHGKTHITVANLSKIDEIDRPKLSFSYPTASD